MRHAPRKTGTKVRNGKVARKNRTELSNHYSQVRQDRTVIDRLRPGEGFKHYLTIADVRQFIELLPDWQELSEGLDAIILDEGGDCMGWHWDGTVAVCAWERELLADWDNDFVKEHAVILDRLGVPREPNPDDSRGTWCHFTESTIKGFQLMHILLHELGHHHDRMSTRSQRGSARGESYAESYALKYADSLWESYFRVFGW
ncbi:hypothetical protein [Aeoliella mucimassa]|uniref:Uncharacterized protein n=1 Tax=Aeoliella mucimassa TaxID=2527972 RepID=A0A518AWT7_9BACT|nr:hypothetical protein [Aeoliella mucimassa]QDU59150.1 hypothetical protein Pan181_53910 [Aeoliella mucimassa]